MKTLESKTLESMHRDAAEHQRALDEPRWISVATLARRLDLSESTVRAIPYDELPFREFGRGLKLRRRRYRLTDVEAYEAKDEQPTPRPRRVRRSA